MKSYSIPAKKIIHFKLLFMLALALIGCKNNKDKVAIKEEKPNILIIYLDDLGYGDVAYNGGKIPTPNIDQLASGGIVFTNGYASSATCTPSRYALLTGMYPWRKKDAKILSGSAPLLIDTAQITIPKLLHNVGYSTGVIGKWHLGLGNGNINWNEMVSPGPNEVGFDYSYIMAATQDRVPTVYLKNEKVINLDVNDPIEVSYDSNFAGQPTGLDNPELVKMKWHHGHNNTIVNGIPRIGFMKGGDSAKWDDYNMSDHFLQEAQDYIIRNKEKPFFLYYAMQQPHVPRTPNPRFKGKSGMGPRGDVIMEADWSIGQVMETLKNQGILENTFIIFTSDNGPVLNDGYYDDAVEKIGDHKPWGKFRGGKYSLFDAGTHVPFITYWKGKINPAISDALVSQLDILASVAKLVNIDDQDVDSQNILGSFMGRNDQGRESLVLEATSRTAFRKGNWVMIPPYEGPEIIKNVNIETGNSEVYQLYNLHQDKGEQTNLVDSNEDKLNEMIKDFELIRGDDYKKIQQLELK